jgi:hypothetical protein
MRRRDFIALLGGGAFAPIILAALATRAQNTSKLPAIGFLGYPLSAGVDALDGRIQRAAARARLGRRPYRHDRVPLG